MNNKSWRGVIGRFLGVYGHTFGGNEQRMEMFEKYYGTYRLMLSVTGLWPYTEFVYRTVQRITFFGLLLSFPVIQAVSHLKSEITLQHGIQMLSAMIPFTLFALRYAFFVADISLIKYLFDLVRMEEGRLQDLNELQILRSSFDVSSYIIYASLWISFLGFIFLATVVLSPIGLDLVNPINESRIRNMRYFTELCTDRNLYIDIVSLQFVLACAVGLLSVVCTEAAFSIITHYSCGLFKISSYRIQNAINNVATSSMVIKSNNRDFSRAIDIHRRAIRCVNLVSSNMVVTYMILSPILVISFALNIHRLSRAFVTMDDGKEILVSVICVTVQLMFLLLNNYCGQLVIDNSLDVCKVSYSSIWYELPLESQKLLAFIMLRSSIECSFNICGIFVPCYRGLSAMLSTSFSYFTVMLSIQ